MVVQLYTSRVILNTLGVEDYGIYNVVGGVIVLFAFINNSLSSASQRFISFAIGQKDSKLVKETFNTCVYCHILMCLVLLLLAETVGLWFVKEKLVIPGDRQSAALWVYQITIVTTFVNLIKVPFNATIISYERMSFYAYTSIIEVLAKLGIVFLLVFSTFDKLITYAILVLSVNVLIFLLYVVYCHSRFDVCHIRKGVDLPQIRKMLSYSGWTMLSSAVTVGNQQGGNMMLNVFFGVAYNAAYGIANQVSNAIYSFVTNFQMAFQPQIVKQYASGEDDNLRKLICRSASFSYYLLLVISIPFVMECDWILKIWLGTPPEYAGVFCELLIAYFLIDAIQAPLWMVIGASGNIRGYTIWSSAIAALNLPIAYVILRCGGGVIWVFSIRVILNLICAIIRVPYVKKFVTLPSLFYVKNVVLPAILTTSAAVILSYLIKERIAAPILSIILSFIVTALSVFIIGLNKQDRSYLIDMVQQKINNPKIKTLCEALESREKFKRLMYDKMPFLVSDKDAIKIFWNLRMDYPLNLKNPETYNEKLQWLKLHDRKPIYTVMVDKFAVKKYVSDIIGENYIIPTIGVWNHFDDIDFEKLPDQFVLKCTHDSGGLVICKDKATLNYEKAKVKIERSLKTNYYSIGREWPYKNVPHRIIAEPYMEDCETKELRDYKFFCFDGKVKWCFIASDRQKREEPYFDFFDMDFNHLSLKHGHPNAPVPPSKPSCFEEMKDVAARLSKGIPQIRVDLYEINGRVYFGELTFYHHAGTVPFEPREWDYTFGKEIILSQRK